MTKTKNITSFNVSWTADHEQYYRGHGIAFSDYTHSGNGVGETIREAFEDALTQLAEQDIDIEHVLESERGEDGMFFNLESAALQELIGQVRDPAMLDWDIVKAECPESGNHECSECGHTNGNHLGKSEQLTNGVAVWDECSHGECECSEYKQDECAVCAGEWHFYVNVDVQVSDEPTYQVIVGNIGAVYSGTSLDDATKAYAEYVGQSRLGYGRASGESVTLMADGEIRQEHAGTVEDDNV